MAKPHRSNETAALHVLGIAQDAGVPHIGCDGPCCAEAWTDPALHRRAACAAIVIRDSGNGLVLRRWLIDATPDIRWQLRALDLAAPANPDMPGPGLDGILLTHAHLGHVGGLGQLGREALGASAVPVFAMPRLFEALRSNAPWSRLLEDGRIVLEPLYAGRAVQLSDSVRLTPVPVLHRTALSETVAFCVEGDQAQVLWLPDVDRWEPAPGADGSGAAPATVFDLSAWTETVDRAYVDGSFFDEQELPGRDRATVPHPTMRDTLALASAWPSQRRRRLRFIHLNHTNPALRPESEARAELRAAGVDVADEGEVMPL